MKCIVDGCVNDARPDSQYCQECWEDVVARAERQWAGDPCCDEPKPSCGCASLDPDSLYAELQDIKRTACESVMQARLDLLELERENRELKATNHVLCCIIESMAETMTPKLAW